MKWNSFTVHTTTEAEDLITDMLSELGITGVEIRDHQAILEGDTFEIFEEVMPKVLPDDGKAEVIFYLGPEEDQEDVLLKVRDGLEELKSFVDIGEGTITEDETEDVDWANNWKAYFKAFYVDDILIKPTWVEAPAENHSGLMVEIDPGTAFGTGSHETTRLCIHGLKKYLKPGDRVLDVGTGSGILGIIALKMGAGFVYGTDIDELAVKAARENVTLNGFGEDRFKLVLGDIITDEAIGEDAGRESYDLVLANILADIIIPLQKGIYKEMKHGAVMITSGIINLKEEQVRNELLANPEFEIIDTVYEGEWVSFVVRRK